MQTLCRNDKVLFWERFSDNEASANSFLGSTCRSLSVNWQRYEGRVHRNLPSSPAKGLQMSSQKGMSVDGQQHCVQEPLKSYKPASLFKRRKTLWHGAQRSSAVHKAVAVKTLSSSIWHYSPTKRIWTIDWSVQKSLVKLNSFFALLPDVH